MQSAALWPPNQAASRPNPFGHADEAGLGAERDSRSSSEYGSVWEADLQPVGRSPRKPATSRLARPMQDLKSSPVANLAVFIIVPWVVFIMVMCPFALYYRHSTMLAWVIFAVAMLVSGGLRLLEHGGRADAAWAKLFFSTYYWQLLSSCCIAATLLGTALGLYAYSRYILVYHIYEGSRFYMNVRPSQAAAEFLDAGMLTFSQDTFVDPTRSIGYKVVERYCVAPIFNHAMATSSSPGKLPLANFWAVGLDCCHGRGSFECGPIWDESAHSGLRVLDAGPLQGEELHNYMIAVHQAAASYGIMAPEKPVLVKWTDSPQNLPKAYWEGGVHFYKKSVGYFIAAEMVLGLFAALFWESRRVSAAPQ
uniref:Uncharacterized protein n=1 Tax=Alexandrium catenella TaxID=2925 RepID=A0A7S1WWH2_ALECA|mmetsp:Transcript_9510/g.25812  ORF Transcript_9510/g.25812 Transcript_9510/m.25812 type:complete len:365 (+) Transcript_9510:71-1165(+)